MSYLVLARKYRPQRFDDLVGQEHVARTLVNAIELGRVHHAFLFTGARGVGKTSAARILAKALCCTNGPTATPCGTCDFCQEIATGQSVDVLEIDGASHTGVDDVRTLREGVRYLPSKGRRKVYIIDEVHMLSTSAFNALLKTLEEPPAHVVFIFATTEVHKIPTTILSRCQRYDFKLVPTAPLVEHLSGILKGETMDFEVEGLRLLVRQAGGSVRDALSLLDQVIAFVGAAQITRERVAEVLGVADRRLHTALLEAVLAHDAGAALRHLNQAALRGVDLAQLGKSFLAFLHDVEIAGLVADASDLIDAAPDELVEAKALAGRAGKGLLGALFDRWARAVDEAGRSQTARLILEMALVDLSFTEPLLPLGDLLRRLEELEGRLIEGAPPGPPGRPGPGGGPPRRDSGGSASFRAAVAEVSAPGSGPRLAVAAAPEPAPGPIGPPVASGPAPVMAAAAAAAAPAAAPPTAAVAVARLADSDPVVVPAPAAGTADETWRLLRLRFEDRPALAAILDHAEVASWQGGRVTLRFGDRFLLERAERSRGLIEQALAAVVGAPASLALQLGSSAPAPGVGAPVVRSSTSREADDAADERRRREEEARRHPIIQRAQEIFNVNAREIKTL